MNDENKAAQEKKTQMQNVVQQMLPDDLKKQFVLQKNTEGGLEKAAPKPPITFDPSGNVAETPSPKLDPNLSQKAIRTFESDLAEALAEKNGSSASIAIAEKKRKEEEVEKAEEAKRAAAVQQPAPQAIPPRPIVRPIAPTSATAIPGATISIPPQMAHDVTLEIEDAIRAAKPIETPVPTPPTPQPKIAVEQAMPKAAPIPQVPPVVTPPPSPKTIIIADEEPRRSHLKPFLLTAVSLVLIGGGLVEGYILYQKTVVETPPAQSPTPIVIPSIIPHDVQTMLPVAHEAGNNLIARMYAELAKHPVAPGKNLEVVLTKAGTQTALGGTEFVNRLDTQMPDVMARSLTDRWMFGVYGEETGNATTFLALTTDFFQNAFAGMLSWEGNDMADDLSILLNFKDKARRDDLGTSTISSYFTIRGQYSDKVIRNRDVREFRNSKGELLFLYSFINKETLILTTTESAFIALIDRVEKDAYVR